MSSLRNFSASKYLMERAERDAKDYLLDYPHGDRLDSTKKSKNLKFYKNKIKSKPDGDLIDNIHKKWRGDYRLLESHHGYIQWLFPIREDGMNSQSQRLMKHERDAMKKCDIIRKRLLESYRLMLDFYGFELSDEETGTITPLPDHSLQFDNLNRCSHNYLRITRILKCLGEINYSRLQYGLIKGILDQIFTHHQLKNTLESAMSFWVAVVRDETQRLSLRQMIERNLSCLNHPQMFPYSYEMINNGIEFQGSDQILHPQNVFNSGDEIQMSIESQPEQNLDQIKNPQLQPLNNGNQYEGNQEINHEYIYPHQNDSIEKIDSSQTSMAGTNFGQTSTSSQSDSVEKPDQTGASPHDIRGDNSLQADVSPQSSSDQINLIDATHSKPTNLRMVDEPMSNLETQNRPDRSITDQNTLQVCDIENPVPVEEEIKNDQKKIEDGESKMDDDSQVQSAKMEDDE